MSDVFKIRKRERRGGTAPLGLRHEWTEWQVVNGRTIVARLGSLRAAIKWVNDTQRLSPQGENRA